MATSSGRATSAKNAVTGDFLLTVHEFAARSPDELSLKKGDRIELIERDDDFGDGWFLGKHLGTGQTGLFPEVYTTIAPKPSSTTTSPQTSSQSNVFNETARPFSPGLTDAHASNELSSNFDQAQANAASSYLHELDSTILPSQQQQQQQQPLQDFATSTQQIQNQNTSPRALHSAYQSQVSPSQNFSRTFTGSTRVPSNNASMMSETLDVIDEHITDMRKPTASRRSGRLSRSSRDADQLSYIAGSETEEEEESHRHTTEEIMAWSPSRVAEYLEDAGVEKKHCDVFKEQEFSGEAVLTMDQSTVFLKELDLGPIGRRLKTWGKIKALQDEAKAATRALKSRNVSESNTIQSPLGIISGAAGAQNQQRHSGPSNRTYNQAKGPSSLDGGSADASPLLHNKQASQQSLDRGWTLSSANRSTPNVLETRNNYHLQTMSGDAQDRGQMHDSARASQLTVSTNQDFDKGYTSGGELESGRNRRILRKKSPSADHARQSSYETKGKRLSFFSKPSSRAPSEAGDKEIGAPGSVIHTDASGTRIVSEPLMENGNPIVTKLEYGTESSRMSAGVSESGKTDATQTTQGKQDGAFSGIRKGLRATSDAITGREKAMHKIAVDAPPAPVAEDETRSSTPSALSNEDAKKSPATGLAPTSGTRRKTKKDTSAYVLGLEKKSPQEQIVDCDFSGWMKKKSSNLITSWKPRLFVLKGRRLSYYYSENDSEEQGLIDISGHRVLSAEGERITGLHASISGAKSSTNSSTSGNLMNTLNSPTAMTTSPTAMEADESSTSPNVVPPAPKESSQGFIFKLVPPRTGMSKAVNFTKPSVHYFAVPSLEEGRLWMAALMKATIDRDESADVVTTYQQKTISLTKARARKERPPALMGVDEENQVTAGQPDRMVYPGTATSTGQETGSAITDEPLSAVSPTSAPLYKSPTNSSHLREQVTPVTDLETQFSRTRTNSSGRIRQLRERKERVGSHGEKESDSPILSRMQDSGLW